MSTLEGGDVEMVKLIFNCFFFSYFLILKEMTKRRSVLDFVLKK